MFEAVSIAFDVPILPPARSSIRIQWPSYHLDLVSFHFFLLSTVVMHISRPEAVLMRYVNRLCTFSADYLNGVSVCSMFTAAGMTRRTFASNSVAIALRQALSHGSKRASI